MSYQTIPLTEEILPALLDLECACFAHPWTENMFLGEIKNPAAHYKILTDGEKAIAYMGRHPRFCNLREQNGKRSMVVKNVETVETAVCILKEIVSMEV